MAIRTLMTKHGIYQAIEVDDGWFLIPSEIGLEAVKVAKIVTAEPVASLCTSLESEVADLFVAEHNFAQPK
jgi:hypothetical protein